MATPVDQDIAQQVANTVREQAAQGNRITIVGGASKSFLGNPVADDLFRLNMSGHRGIISYEPRELVVRVRSGTPLATVVSLLAGEGQMLAFDPPDYDGRSSIGGTVSCGLSGARRPWAGSARDFVLGVGLITGVGVQHEFGGQVMKNVAGYDVSRLVTGAFGTLGVITDVSLKVLPLPELEVTLVQSIETASALNKLTEVRNAALPLSGLLVADDKLYIRLSGTETGVTSARNRLGGEVVDNAFWSAVSNQSLPRFADGRRLWRLSVPPDAPDYFDEASVIDWGGALRWVLDPEVTPRPLDNGHAWLYRDAGDAIFKGDHMAPLSEYAAGIHQRLKKVFDPSGVLNPGRMYRGL